MLTLDMILGGGWPKGRVVEVWILTARYIIHLLFWKACKIKQTLNAILVICSMPIASDQKDQGCKYPIGLLYLQETDSQLLSICLCLSYFSAFANLKWSSSDDMSWIIYDSNGCNITKSSLLRSHCEHAPLSPLQKPFWTLLFDT